MVPEIWSVTDRIFCHSGQFFALLHPYRPRKSKFLKNWKNTWRYYHFKNVHHKWQSYDVWFLRYGMQQTEFLSFWTVFCPFAPQKPKKSKFWKNLKKTPGDIISHTCTKNYDQMMYSSWDMVHDRCNCYFSFWAIFCPFTTLTAQKTKFWKNEKNTMTYDHFTYVYRKLWSDDVWFLRYGAWQV